MLRYLLKPETNSYEVIGETDTTAERIVIPDFYEGLPVTISSVFLETCPNVKEIVFGNNVKTISYGTLNSEHIEKIYFGRATEKISGPFDLCTNLTDIYYSGSQEDWEKIDVVTVDDSILLFENVPVHYGVLGQGGYLTLGEETLFPYTHWNCIKGKPETIDSEKITYENDVSGLKADNVKSAIDELNSKHFDVSSLESWESLLHLVRSGRAKDFINIGDKFICEKNGKSMEWDVIGIDEDTPSNTKHKHSLTLQLSFCWANMPFSVPDASYFANIGLKQGKYYIGLKNYSGNIVYYAFTLNEAVPDDALIRISENKVYIYSNRNSAEYTSFDVDSSADSAEGMEGTNLGIGNYIIHSSMGSVNYSSSDIRQWLNSDKTDWWKSAESNSLAPLDYLNIPGFENGVDEDFLKVVNPVVKEATLPDGSKVTCEDRFFLLSLEEVYGCEGKAYSYYREGTSLNAPGLTADALRVRNFEGNPRYWWLRDSASSDDGLMRVTPTGAIGPVKTSRVLAYGITPACCIC